LVSTFAIQRTILHHSSPDTHVHIRGYLVHHLFSGAILQTTAALVLACGTGASWMRVLARLALGVGSAMVLDEVIYLVCTDGSGVAYRGPVSLWGAVVLESLAAGLLLGLYRFARRQDA
jgi:hypothetical protein